MPTKPVAPVSRWAPSGMSERAASDTGFRDSSGRVRSVQARGRGPPVQWEDGEPSQPLTRPAVQVTRDWALPGAGALKRAWSDDAPSEVVQRVRDRAVDPHLEVQVRPEAQPGAAAVADDLALADGRAERRREARLVRVARGERRGVRDARVVAVAARRAHRLHERDLARRRRADRRAARHADVDARMARLPGAALAERRG